MNNREAFEAQRVLINLFERWKGYELPYLNSDNQFDKEWLHREWVAFQAGYQAALTSQAQQTESRWMIPTESQILAATEKAGLWPNTVYTWLPAFHRYHAELAKLQPAPEGDKE